MTSHAISSSLARSVTAALLTTVALTVTTPTLAQSSFFSDWHNSQNLSQGFSVEFTDQKLSVTGNNIPVKELLLEIQEQTGIKVNFVVSSNDRVTLDVKEQSVENVISQISDNHMIIHSQVNGTKTVSELFIILDGNEEIVAAAETSEFLPTGEPTPLIAAATPQLTDEKESQKL